MTITFLDPRDQSTKTFNSDIIDQFLADWSAAISRITIQRVKSNINNLISLISERNVENTQMEYIYLDINYFDVPSYLTEIMNLTESYGIPIFIRLYNIYSGSYKEISALFKDKQCLKGLVLGPSAEYQNVTEEFINTLLTTDIYSLSLYFITPEVNIFFKLIKSNKLIKIELANDKTLGYGSTVNKTFNELLTSLSNTPQSILQQLIVNSIEICHPDVDQNNTAYLATLIQENVNLTEINLRSCRLTTDFLTLLARKLIQTANISSQPLKLILGSNLTVSLVMPQICQSLAANINIGELDLYNTGINNNGAGLLAEALKQNTVLAKLSLQNCPIDHNVQAICQAIIDNPSTSMVSLDLMVIEGFDLDDAESIAKLIRSNKITELKIYRSFNPDLDEEEKINIYNVLLDAYVENSSITTSDLFFSGVSLREGEIYDKLKHIFIIRSIPIKFEHLRNDELYELMQLQIDNYAVSSKTLIQILQEYKK